MAVLITGASGFIGTHLLHRLSKSGRMVRVLVHRKAVQEGPGIEIAKGDLKDPAALDKAVRGIDVLFHLAAAVGSTVKDPKEFSKVNADGTQNLLLAAKNAGIRRIIHISSAGVLGSVEAGKAVNETYRINPQNEYDLTKLQGEKIAKKFAGQGMDIQIIRPGWTYGPGDPRTFKLIRAIHQKRFIMVTKGQSLQTPVYIDDLIEGILLCEKKGRAGEVYHLAGNEVLPVREMVETIAEASGSTIPGIHLPLIPVKLAAWTLEKLFSFFRKEAPLNPGKLAFFIHPKPLAIQKAVNDLGFFPKTDFKTGMIQTVAWYREQGWL